MKILYLITKSELGGAQTHVAQLVDFFVSQGHEIFVMAYPGGWLEQKTKELGATFIPNRFFSNSFNPLGIFRAQRLIKKTVEDIKPNIIHCHSSSAAFVGRLAIRKKIPTIYTAHGWGFNIGISVFQKYIAILAERLVAPFTDKIICVSQFVRNLALKYHIAPQDKFEVIYNGVELNSLPRVTNDDVVNLVFIGRLEEPKNPLLLLQALSQLPEKIQSCVRLNIVGDGSKRVELESYIASHNLSQVRLLGELPRDSIFDILNGTDIFVLPTKWEGLPITILEAMAAGLPIIASDVGGIPEIVHNGKNGFLIHGDNLQEMKNILLKLITDQKLRIEMGEKSRAIIEQNFELKNMLIKVEQVYKSVISK